MKKINILLATFAMLAFWSCEPLGDELDEIKSNSTIAKNITYTLTEDDYESAGAVCDCIEDESFSSIDAVKEYVPAILADQFPSLGLKSTSIVTYNFNRGRYEGIDQYTTADTYTVTNADYASVSTDAGSAKFFNKSTTSSANVPSILAANVSGASADDLTAVTYEYANVKYSDIEGGELYKEDFESLSDLSSLNTISVEGDKVWEIYSSSSGYKAARMSGFDGGNQANVDWMILPQIDLAGSSNVNFKLSHVVNFLGTGTLGGDLDVRVSTDYDGGADPSTSTWTSLSLDVWPDGDNYDISASKASLSAFDGQQIYIAFYFKSTTEYAPQWRLIDIVVDWGETIETTTKKDFYSFDGSAWEAVDDNVYFLSSLDYDNMGAPGRFNNFSSSTPADNYLAQFLKSFLPYAQDGDEQVVIYDYFSSTSGAQVRGDYYTFSGGTWSEYESVVVNTFSFGHNGIAWEPDNTINISLDSEDYTAIASATETSNPDGSASAGQYNNFDLSLWSSSQIFDVITTRLLDKVPSVDEQKYLVTYATWEPGAGSGEIHVIYSEADQAYLLVEN